MKERAATLTRTSEEPPDLPGLKGTLETEDLLDLLDLKDLKGLQVLGGLRDLKVKVSSTTGMAISLGYG